MYILNNNVYYVVLYYNRNYLYQLKLKVLHCSNISLKYLLINF